MATRKSTAANDVINSGISLTEEEAFSLSGEVEQLAHMFAALHQLAIEVAAGCSEMRAAALVSAQHLGMLGAMKADYIAQQLGSPAIGLFSEEVEKLAAWNVRKALKAAKQEVRQ